MTSTVCQVCDAATSGFLCKPCARELQRAVAEMPALLTELGTVIARQSRVYRASGRSQRPAEHAGDPEAEIPAWLRTKDGRVALRSTTLPVDLDAAELRWVAMNTLSTWARIIAEHRGVDGPTDANLFPWLATYAESVRWQDDAGECHDEITALRREIERAVDRSPARMYAGPCTNDECRVEHDGKMVPRDLYAAPDRDQIVCDGHRGDGIGCQATYDLLERRTWLVETVQTHLAPIDALMDAIPALFPDMPRVPRASYIGWVRSGRIVPHGHTDVGEPTYSGREVLELVEQYRPKRYAPRPTRRSA